MVRLLKKFAADESGVTAVEYALLAAAAAGVFATAGTTFYTKIETSLNGLFPDGGGTSSSF